MNLVIRPISMPQLQQRTNNNKMSFQGIKEQEIFIRALKISELKEVLSKNDPITAKEYFIKVYEKLKNKFSNNNYKFVREEEYTSQNKSFVFRWGKSRKEKAHIAFDLKTEEPVIWYQEVQDLTKKFKGGFTIMYMYKGDEISRARGFRTINTRGLIQTGNKQLEPMKSTLTLVEETLGPKNKRFAKPERFLEE